MTSSTDHCALCDRFLIEVCTVCVQVTAIAIMAAWRGLKELAMARRISGSRIH